jgi:cyclase
MQPYVEEVAERVFAYVQPDGGWCLNNAGIVRGSERALLVDTAATEHRARLLRAETERLGAAPDLVVNTHFHGDHTFGNCVFPTALHVGHELTRTLVEEAGLHLTKLWPQVDWGSLTPAPPKLTYRRAMTLHLGDIRAELMHLGPAHSPDDTVVWLPEQSVLFTGDLVLSRVTPFVVMGSLDGSLRAIEALRDLGARTLVTGHGPVTGPDVLDVTERYLVWLRSLATDGIAAGLTPLQVARETDLGEFGELLDGERLVANLHRAYAEARGAAPAEPLDIEKVFAEMIEHHGRLPDCRA